MRYISYDGCDIDNTYELLERLHEKKLKVDYIEYRAAYKENENIKKDYDLNKIPMLLSQQEYKDIICISHNEHYFYISVNDVLRDFRNIVVLMINKKLVNEKEYLLYDDNENFEKLIDVYSVEKLKNIIKNPCKYENLKEKELEIKKKSIKEMIKNMIK